MRLSGVRGGEMVALPELKNVVSERALTQSELYTKTGISLTTIKKAIKGEPVRDYIAKKLADALRLPVDSLRIEGQGGSNGVAPVQPPPELSLVAGQKKPVQYPKSTRPEDYEFTIHEARLNRMETRMDNIEKTLTTISDSMAEIATRPEVTPKRMMVISEYDD